MPIEALKASWEVVVGVIPGQPMPEYSKRWFYTSSDFEKDRTNEDTVGDNIFTAKMREANEYAMQMTDPRRINWVRMEFLWM